MVCQCQRKQKLWVGHKDLSKILKFDLEVIGQCHIRIMNACDTSFHADKPGVRYGTSKSILKQKKFEPDTNLHRQTDGWTE